MHRYSRTFSWSVAGTSSFRRFFLPGLTPSRFGGFLGDFRSPLGCQLGRTGLTARQSSKPAQFGSSRRLRGRRWLLLPRRNVDDRLGELVGVAGALGVAICHNWLTLSI